MGITFIPIILSHLYKELQMYSLLMQMVWLLVYLHPDLDCTQVYYEYVKYAISNMLVLCLVPAVPFHVMLNKIHYACIYLSVLHC